MAAFGLEFQRLSWIFRISLIYMAYDLTKTDDRLVVTRILRDVAIAAAASEPTRVKLLSGDNEKILDVIKDVHSDICESIQNKKSGTTTAVDQKVTSADPNLIPLDQIEFVPLGDHRPLIIAPDYLGKMIIVLNGPTKERFVTALGSFPAGSTPTTTYNFMEPC